MAEIGSAVAGKVVDSMFVVAKKEISYMWNCTQNVEKFKKALLDLKDTRGRAQQQIDTANAKGDDLLFGVEHWMHEADQQISKAEEFLEQEANAKKTCFKIGVCGNWSTLYRYGKEAIKKAPLLVQHQESGKSFETCVSVDTPAPGRLEIYKNKNLDDIVTHKSALGDIIKSVEDESIQIVGIYGVGGVGKTTLAMEVATRVKHLFAAVAFTSVSHIVDADKIKEDTKEAIKRTMKGDKVLIILDDVWEKLNLEELCIPCGIEYKNCKILLTSRSQDVCHKMNAQSKICINSLPIEDAWILFKDVAGERVENDAYLKPVALMVVEECGGLPLLIQALGNALKGESIDSWNSALARLKKHAPLDIDPEIRKAFTHLQLSYDYLKSGEAKSCFLLCSMFPEDSYISLEDLVRYEVGLGKFDNLDSMEDARNRVQTAVNILTSSGLLLYVDRKHSTKMHDVVRDVALLIASKGDNKYMVEAGKGVTDWLPRHNALEGYTGISLMENKISRLPDYEVHLPHLNIILIQSAFQLPTISDEFVGSMKEVKVLDMAWNKISSLPRSLKLLTKLRMLNLEGNTRLHEISILGELKDLEILILSDTEIKEIPQEIGQLVNLRRLEVLGCEHLSHITPGVISKLWRLEELCIQFTWVVEGVYDCVAEVMNLLKLTYLELIVGSLVHIPEGFNFENLERFVVQVRRDYLAIDSTFVSKRSLVIQLDYLWIPFLKWIKNLVELIRPNTILIGIKNLKNILPYLYHEGFNKLEYIELYSCLNVSCLVDTSDWDQLEPNEKFFVELKHLRLIYLDNLKVLWKCRDQNISLTNLVTLYIHGCHKLVTLFSVSVAQGLVNLKKLHIEFCKGLEEVIWDGDHDEIHKVSETEMVVHEHATNIIVFPSLEQIIFCFSKRLESFYSGSSIIKYPSLMNVSIEDCRMKRWGPGIHETPNLKFVNDVPLDGPYAIDDAVVKYHKQQEERVE